MHSFPLAAANPIRRRSALLQNRLVPLLLGLALVCSALAETNPNELFEAERVDVPPRPVRTGELEYPPALREDGIAGIALTEFVVGVDGKVEAAHCLAANDPRFGQAAEEYVRNCRYEPGRIAGRAVRTLCRRHDAFDVINRGGAQPVFSLAATAAEREGLPTELPFRAFVGDVPVFVGSIPTVYPYEALLGSKSGKVVVEFVVGNDALAHSVSVREASSAEFAAAALARLECAWFAPGISRDKHRNNGPFLATFVFEPSGSDSVAVSDQTRNMIKTVRNHPERIVTTGLDSAPMPIRRVTPVPPTSIAASGRAVVEVLIDKYGYPQLPRVVSCTAPEFGAAAAQAIVQWLFVPAQRKGRPEITKVQVPFTFEFQATPRPVGKGG